MATPDNVLAFWFGPPDSPEHCVPREVWFKKSAAFDAEIRTRFLRDFEDARDGRLRDWAESAEGCLALIILLDQFPRNMYRGLPETYATDKAALALAAHALRGGYDMMLPPVMRTFVYMPYMHSEELADQQECLARVEALPDGKFFEGNRKSARQHLRIIERFARFPHRNAVLERDSTPEELNFLKEPGSSF